MTYKEARLKAVKCARSQWQKMLMLNNLAFGSPRLTDWCAPTPSGNGTNLSHLHQQRVLLDRFEKERIPFDLVWHGTRTLGLIQQRLSRAELFISGGLSELQVSRFLEGESYTTDIYSYHLVFLWGLREVWAYRRRKKKIGEYWKRLGRTRPIMLSFLFNRETHRLFLRELFGHTLFSPVQERYVELIRLFFGLRVLECTLALFGDAMNRNVGLTDEIMKEYGERFERAEEYVEGHLGWAVVEELNAEIAMGLVPEVVMDALSPTWRSDWWERRYMWSEVKDIIVKDVGGKSMDPKPGEKKKPRAWPVMGGKIAVYIP